MGALTQLDTEYQSYSLSLRADHHLSSIVFRRCQSSGSHIYRSEVIQNGGRGQLIIVPNNKGGQAVEGHSHYTTVKHEIQPFSGGSKVFLIYVLLFLKLPLISGSYFRNMLRRVESIQAEPIPAGKP